MALTKAMKRIEKYLNVRVPQKQDLVLVVCVYFLLLKTKHPTTPGTDIIIGLILIRTRSLSSN